MTKVQVTYEFDTPVDDAALAAIEQLHGVYGFQALRLSPALDSLVVLYDATRMSPEDVERRLHGAGLRVRRMATV